MAEQLTPEQRQNWQNDAAYWAVVQEDAERALAVATKRRRLALGKLGLLADTEEDDEC